MHRPAHRLLTLAVVSIAACTPSPGVGPSPSSPGAPPSVSTLAPAPTPTSAPTPSAASTAVALERPASDWITHVVKDLMPFWMMASAKGKNPNGPFPSYRCRDGKAFGEAGCDLKSGEFKFLADVNRAYHAYKQSGPYDWVTGPNNELEKRAYVRMHSRQTYAYSVAFHLTGDKQYLDLAQRGAKWLLANAIDKKGGSFVFMEDGKLGPDAKYRTSQDQSYTLMGLAFYYYVTRDPQVLEQLNRLKEDVKKQFNWPEECKPGGCLLKWMNESHVGEAVPPADRGTNKQKELVALLDQVNAYMLLLTTSVPAKDRDAWLADLFSMAQTIRGRFFNDGTKDNQKDTGFVKSAVPVGMFAGCLSYERACKDTRAVDPENCDPANHHTDFGHSIKSFWMLYLIGREKGGADGDTMATFALDGANKMFPKAYLDDGSWGRAMKNVAGCSSAPQFVADRDKEWWIYAELDQMAGTMALADPGTHVPRLNTTYEWWLQHFVDRSALYPENEKAQSRQFEVDQYRCDLDRSCTNDSIPKANLWKNGFHSTEHGLVAYITGSGVSKTPAILYYALLSDPKQTSLQPYYYRATAKAGEPTPLESDGTKYQVVRVEFTDIR